MIDKSLSLAAALAVAAMLSTAFTVAKAAQTSPASSAAASPTAKPSPYPSSSQDPYHGVSVPPADAILTNDESAQPAPAASEALPATNSAEDDAETAASPDRAAAPKLLARPAETFAPAPIDPDSEIVTYLPGPANALPEGTAFRVRMSQEIIASDAIPGTPFRAQLSQDLMHDGRIVIPAGSTLIGKIVYATSGRRIGGQSSIHLRPDAFILPDGVHYQLHAEAIDTQGSDTKPTGEGNISSTDHGKRTLIELAAGSGGGALLGAAVAGPTGAIVGTAVGAGVIGAHWLLSTRSAEIPAESTVVFSLTEPLFLTPSGK